MAQDKPTIRDETVTDGSPVLPYVRQSKAREGESAATSLSLDTQFAMIQAWAARQGATLLAPIADHDETGRRMDRPGLTELRAKIAAMPGLTVAVYKYDRLARNLIGAELVVSELEAAGARVVSITEPAGKLSRQMHGIIAEYQSDQHAERIAAVRERSARRGHYTGGAAPFGYQRGRVDVVVRNDVPVRERRVGIPEPDPATAPVVVDLFARFVAGASVFELVRDLVARGVPTLRGGAWDYTHVARILRNPFYAGLITHRGEIVAEGRHAPIIDRATWEAARARFARIVPVRHRPAHGESSWLAGLVTHACGARAYLIVTTGQPRQDGSVPLVAKFVCATQPRADACGLRPMILSRAKLERAARSCLAADLAALVSLDAALARATTVAGGDAAARRRTALDERTRRAERRRERARELWLAGEDDLTAWRSEQARYAAELDEIARELVRLPAAPDLAAYHAAASALGSMAAVIEAASGEALRAILETVGTLVYGPAGVTVHYHPPFDAFIAHPTVLPVR